MKFYAGMISAIGGAILVCISVMSAYNGWVIENKNTAERLTKSISVGEENSKKLDSLDSKVEKIARSIGINVAADGGTQ